MLRSLLFALLLATTAHAQWDLQNSGTTADLRGIASVGKGIAWASGSNGTVLRTEDGGHLWQRCTVPPGADKLDFRGIQAFDANTAIVMSSGKGDLSRLYKTTDSCQTWKLVFTNPDKDGFWDALVMNWIAGDKKHDYSLGFVLGDPVGKEFVYYKSDNNWRDWRREKSHGLEAGPTSSGAFAASNTSLVEYGTTAAFGTGGTDGAFVYIVEESEICLHCSEQEAIASEDKEKWARYPVPVGSHTESSGIFSLAIKTSLERPNYPLTLVTVGGNYQEAQSSANTSSVSSDGGKTWTASTTMPHGYRSAVAYDASTTTWITVGPNGTDISTDDGRNWRALKPRPTDTPDADQHWNALSLPFVVGPHGRIGRLNPAALSANGATSSQPRAKP